MKIETSKGFQSTPLTRVETQNEGTAAGRGEPFQSTPLTRGETSVILPFAHVQYFNPLPSHEGRPCSFTSSSFRHHFNPLPSHEGRLQAFLDSTATPIFQSTPLTRGETLVVLACGSHPSDFNPLPSHEGRLVAEVNKRFPAVISIHSPHTRGDRVRRPLVLFHAISIHSPHTRGDAESGCGASGHDISIHSPHTRGDMSLLIILMVMEQFQSTPLTRGETSAGDGARCRANISIHSPHTRGDLVEAIIARHAQNISIHSPHTRGDGGPYPIGYDPDDFNPLPSHEGRPCKNTGRFRCGHFNPLPSHEGRREVTEAVAQYRRISIHSPHTRGDASACMWSCDQRGHFNPLPSHEGRPAS